MSTFDIRSGFRADETRPIADMGRAELMRFGRDLAVGRYTFEPGWRWSQHVKPAAGTDSCEVTHLGLCLSGRLHVRMDDGREGDVGPGDYLCIEAGHDAWVIGDEPCVLLDFTGASDYAQAAFRASRASAEPAEPPPPML